MKKLGGDFQDSGIRVISAKNIQGSRIDDRNLRYVSKEIFQKWMPNQLRRGDVLLTSEAPLGEIAYLDADLEACLGQRLFALRANPEVLDGRYLYYSLSWGPSRDEILSRATGTTVVGIRQAELVKVGIVLPPLFEQRAVAEMLGGLDDKIESNRRVVNVGVMLARALVSQGKSLVRLGDIASIQNGLSYMGSGLEGSAEDGLPMINLANFSTSGWMVPSGVKYYSGDFKPKHQVEAGDVVVANTDLTQQRIILGRAALVPPHLAGALFTHHVCAIRLLDSTAELMKISIWGQLNSSRFRERAEGFATGTTVAGLPIDALLDFEVSIPNEQDAQAAQLVLDQVWSAEAEIVSLVSMRDVLLPELLSGRLRVDEATDLVGSL